MAVTEHFGLSKPDTADHVDAEFFRLQAVWDQLDAILYSLQQSVAGKAAADHSHTIEQVQNLAAALAGKMNADKTFSLDDLTDVEGAGSAALNYVLVRNAQGVWVPSSAIAALGIHEHSMPQVQGLAEVLADKASTTSLSLAVNALNLALSKRLQVDAAQTFTEAEKGRALANAGAGVLAGLRNKLLNGAFDIWQRGTGPFSNGYGADRWLLSNGAGATNSISRAAAASAYPSLARYVMSWARSVAGSAASQIIQKMEDVRTLSGKRVTLTFWAASNAPTEIQAYFAQVFGTGGSPDATVNVAAQTFSLDGNPKKLTATFDIPPVSGKAVGSNGDDCLWLLFRRLHTATNPTALVNLTLVSVVEGDATAEDDPFSPRHPQQELALCQRYYERADESDVGDTPVTGGNTTSGQNYYSMTKFSVPKRTVPTVTRSTLNAGTSFSSVTVNGISKGGFTIQATANATSNNVIVSDWAADAEL